MAFKLKYRVLEKFDSILFNKKAMLGLAILAPVMFSLSALYLGGYFDGIKFPLMNANWHKNENTDKALVSSSPVEEKPSVFKDALRPLYGEAVSLKFPNLNSAVNLEAVGLDSDKALEAPKDWKVGGWYKYGSRPGEEGNVIINAHYDDNYGRPAAFWELKNLKVDDKVFIEDRYGKLYAYSVTESFLVGINDPNRLQIFDGNEDQSVLTLVTCGGVWLPGRATYDKRLVVKAELVVE
jgi:LPXTG-site transpeptidase (sortase) family protein